MVPAGPAQALYVAKFSRVRIRQIITQPCQVYWDPALVHLLVLTAQILSPKKRVIRVRTDLHNCQVAVERVILIVRKTKEWLVV